MAIRIENIPVDGQGDKRILLTNSGIARKLDIGNNWRRLRIGLRISLNDAGDNLSSGNKFYVGVMEDPDSGLTNGPLGINTNRFLGITTDDTLIWNRFTTSTPHYYFNSSTGAYRYVRKHESTETNFEGPIAFRTTASPTTTRTLLMVEVSFNDAQTTVGYGIWSPGNNVGAQRDYSKEELISAMEISDATAARDFLGNLSGTTTNYISAARPNTFFTYNTSAFDLNSIVVAWNRTWTPLIISDILWCKLA